MRKLYFLGACLSLFLSSVQGQTISTSGGGTNWNSGASWIGGVPPTAANSTSIQINHNITIPSGFTAVADQITVATGINLTIDAGGTLDLQNSGGVDLTLQEDLITLFIGSNLIVNGDFFNNSTTALDLGIGLSTTSFNSGGRYYHMINGGALPFDGVTWDDNSLCEIRGATSSAPTNIAQTFGHFTWNCSGHTGSISLLLHQATIDGDLSILNTNGPGILALANVGNATLDINGDFFVSGNSRFILTPGGASQTFTLDVDGEFNFASTAVNQSILITGGTGAILNFNLGGNFTVSSGNLQSRATAAPTVNVNFDGVAAQSFNTSGGTLTNPFNWRIRNGSRVNAGTSAFVGTGSFTLEAGGTLGVGSPDGLVSGTSAGNVRTSTKSYIADGNIVYNGAVAQNLGDEWGSGALSGVAVNLEIANTHSGVTNNIIGSTNIVGDLRLTTGSLNIGNTNTLSIRNDFFATGGTIGGQSTSNLEFTSSGSFTGSLVFTSGAEHLNNLTIDRAGNYVLGSNLEVHGTLAFTTLGSLQTDGRTLTVSGNMTQASSGGVYALTAANSNLIIAGSGAFGSLAFCTTCAGTVEMNNVTLTRTGSPSYTWDDNVNINGTFTLATGTLTHTSGLHMVTGSTFARTAGATILNAAPIASSRYHVSYSGSLTTGLELPSSATALDNLTTSGAVVLDKNITINGNTNINSGLFNAGNFTMAVAGPQFNVNGGSFTTNATVTFTRAGTTTFGGTGSTVFAGLTINPGATVSASSGMIEVRGTWDNNGVFTPNAGTVEFDGAVQSIDPAGQPFNHVIFAGTSTKTITTTLDVNGDLTITSTLAAGTAPTSNIQINVAGVWTNSGTFVPNNGTVVFDGAAQSINPNGQPFYGLTLANSGTKTLAAAIDINGALTINSGVTFDVSASSFSVNLAGNWNNNGSFTRRTGTVFLDGSSTQLLQGSAVTDFNNLNISNVSGPPAVQVTSNQNLRGVLTLASNSRLDSDGPLGSVVFTLISTGDSPTADAAIAALPAGAAVDGNITVQRFMAIEGNSNGRVYRYISSPVNNPTVADIQNEIPVTGSFTGTSACSGCGTTQSMFLYTESVTTDLDVSGIADYNDGYTDFPLNANTEQFAPGRGYAIFVRGDIAPVSTAGNAGWNLRGNINVGTVAYPMSFTSSGTLANDGWNLVGNPYPSTIDWDAATGWTRTNVNNAVYMRNNGLASPVYATYINGVGLNGGSRYIPIGQAFFVKSDGGAITFNSNELVKVAGQQTTYFRERDPDQVLRIAMSQFNVSDETVIRFMPDATVDFDGHSDAYKLDNQSFNLFSEPKPGLRLAVNALPSLECATEVPLHVSKTVDGTYALNFSEMESFPDDYQFQLIDKFLEATIDVKENPDYDFTVTSAPGSFTDRFVVIVSKVAVDINMDVEGDEVCAGTEAAVLISNSQQGVQYQAFIDDEAVSDLITGTGSSLPINFSTADLPAGELNVVIRAGHPGCTQLSLVKTPKVINAAKSDVTNVSSETHCGAGQVLLTASASNQGTLKWYETIDAPTAIAGTSGNQYLTTALVKTHTYYVSAINALGCESARVPVDAGISYPYEVASTAGVSQCGAGAVSLSATGAPEGGHYAWFVTASGSAPIPGEADGTLEIASLSETTTYYVGVVNAEGCMGAVVPVVAEIKGVEAAISESNGILSSESSGGNQWYFNGSVIPGATGQSIVPESSGIYKLVVTLGNCSSTAEVNYSVTGLEGEGNDAVRFYPNPVADWLHVEVVSDNEVSIGIFSALGSQVANGVLEGGAKVKKGRFNLSGAAAGTYVVLIREGSKVYSKRIIKKY